MPRSQHLRALQNYVAALKGVKEHYMGQAEALASKLSKEKPNLSRVRGGRISEKLFVLDYMLEVNGKLLDYLMLYQKDLPVMLVGTSRGPSSLATHALDAILKQVAEDVVLNDESDIHEVITSIEAAVLEHAPAVAEQLKKDAQFRSWVYWLLSPLPFIAACMLGPGLPLYAVSMAVVGPFAPVVFGVAMIASVFLTAHMLVHSDWYAQTEVRDLKTDDVIAPGLVMPFLSKEDEGRLFERTSAYRGPVTTSNQSKGSYKIERSSGRSFSIFHSKMRSTLRSEGLGEELRQEVKEAYNTLQLP
jgi:hypothetical protein